MACRGCWGVLCSRADMGAWGRAKAVPRGPDIRDRRGGGGGGCSRGPDIRDGIKALKRHRPHRITPRSDTPPHALAAARARSLRHHPLAQISHTRSGTPTAGPSGPGGRQAAPSVAQPGIPDARDSETPPSGCRHRAPRLRAGARPAPRSGIRDRQARRALGGGAIGGGLGGCL